MLEKMEFELKKNCIYCFNPILEKNKYHIVEQCIGGTLIYPLGCKKCNTEKLGGIENNLTKDYWVNFAKKRLGLRGFKIDPAFQLDNRQNKYTTQLLPNGKEIDVPLITDKMTWRIIAKIAYDSAAYFIGERVFLPTFDEYREFILTGEPDLAGKRIIRCCYDLPWAPGHVIEFCPHEEFFDVQIRLFNAYIFTSFFWQPVGGPNIFPARVIIDLDSRKTLFEKLSADGRCWERIGGY